MTISHSYCLDDSGGVFLTSFDIFMSFKSFDVISSAVKQISNIPPDQFGSRHMISIHYVLDVSSREGDLKERLINIGHTVTSRHQRPQEGGARPGVGNN